MKGCSVGDWGLIWCRSQSATVSSQKWAARFPLLGTFSNAKASNLETDFDEIKTKTGLFMMGNGYSHIGHDIIGDMVMVVRKEGALPEVAVWTGVP